MIAKRWRWFWWAVYLAWSAVFSPDHVERVEADHVVMAHMRIRRGNVPRNEAEK